MTTPIIQFPQTPWFDPGTNDISLEWKMWLQNPQVLSIIIGAAVPVDSGGTGLTSGTSGGILGFTASTTIASSVELSANQIVLGGGAGATPIPLGTLGTASTLLHGNAAGAPTFGAVDLATETTGTLTIAQGGTNSGVPLDGSAIIISNGSAIVQGPKGIDTKVLHGNASGMPQYGFVVEDDQALIDVTTRNVTSALHGYAPKAPADATKFLNGAATPAYALVKDSDLSTSDITTNNVTSAKHGFAPKSPADATTFLNGAATPVFALVKDSDLSTSDITTNNVSTSKHGFAPKAPNDATKYLDGTGAYSTPTGNVSAWSTFTVSRTGWTDVGAPTVTGRKCTVGNVAHFQVKVVPGTTVATIAGTSYIDLPYTAAGLSGEGTMMNLTTLIGIGNCVVDVANSRVYVPTQTATGNTLTIAGWFEV